MSLSLLFHIALIALIGVGGVALLCCGVVYFTRETGQRASRSHSWPTFRIPQQDWDAPSPRAHLAPGLSIDVLPCMRDGYYPGAPLEPLPPMNLPGWDTQESDGLGDHPAGEPTPNQRQALRQPHVLPSRVIAALENASPDDTAIDGRLTGARDAWETGEADDPFEGFGDAEGWVRALFAGQVSVTA